MKDILFACDLDNTLLYSWKHRQPDDICIEWINGKEQGFMTPRAVNLLTAVQSTVRLIPVTTRSVEQYKRIVWPDRCTPEYAVAANGAVLLKNGEVVKSWREASETFIVPYLKELTGLMPKFSDTHRFPRCRIVDESYLFVSCGWDVDAVECARFYSTATSLNVVSSGRKIYFFPPGLGKGEALVRLKERFHPTTVIAAGDSTIDTSLLNEADVSIIPIGFPDAVRPKTCIHVSADGIPFSDFVLENVQHICEKIIRQ